MAKKGRTRKSSTLASLRKRGMRAKAFADGYAARDAIIHAGQMVRTMRLDAGLTQAELARNAGMSQPEISRLESGLGTQGPSVETLNRLVQACNFRLVIGMQAVAAAAKEGDAAELKYLTEM